MTSLVTMPFGAYLGAPEVSKSNLDLIERSPAHLKHYLDHPESREETPAMRFGSLVHTAVLEPDLLASEYIVMPEDLKKPTPQQINAKKPSPATVELLDRWKEFEQESSGKTVVDKFDLEASEAMRKAVMEHSKARSLLSIGEPEQSVFWDNRETGVACKARTDWIHGHQQSLLVDLKTTNDARPESFIRSILKFRYDVQSAHYTDGFNIDKFVFIAVEKKPPHGVAVYAVDGELFQRGDLARLANLETYAECQATDNWPGYSEKIQTLELPNWAK